MEGRALPAFCTGTQNRMLLNAPPHITTDMLSTPQFPACPLVHTIAKFKAIYLA